MKAGALYQYRLDGGDLLVADLASRFQPRGPHGPSEVIDPSRFEWTDGDWKGVPQAGQVFYELHIGTFTPAGTFAGAIQKLPQLVDIGVTAIEVMPVAEFPGEFGWGYDGTHLFAPTRLYGRPDDFRRLVNAAHKLGLGVILDVVYNHFGPDGNYVREFAPQFQSKIHKTEWGEPFNFDGEECGPVREFFVENAGYWVDEFHVDGLRIDATQAMTDDSETHVLGEINHAVREAGKGRSTFVMGENEPQEVKLLRTPEEGGDGLDALWNDDLHHALRVALTGKNEGYFIDYRGTPRELVAAAKWGFLYQGQQYIWHGHRRGTPTLGIDRHRFISFLENHDQIANSGRGRRVHQLTGPAKYRAATAYLLLIPATPMLFQGQEWGSSKPFVYFADHSPELSQAVRQGRREALARFRSQAGDEGQSLVGDPASPAAFAGCKLDWAERAARPESVAMHRDLIALRKGDPTLARGTIDGATLTDSAFLIRFFGEGGDDRLLVVNLGRDESYEPCPEPLLAPPAGASSWEVLWSSESVAYGGQGTPPLDTDKGWYFPGESAVLLTPKR